MKPYRIHAIMAGSLYILGTVAGVLSVVVIGGFPDASFLSRVAANPAAARVGALLVLAMGLSLAAMTVFLYPLFRKDSEPLALGMLLFRGALEGAWYIVTATSWIAVISLAAQLHAGANAAMVETIAKVTIETSGRLGDLGTIIFLVGASCLYVSFYRTRLIPRWLSLWGLVATTPYLLNALLLFFELPASNLLYMPLAVQEMVMGGWLIIVGFNRDGVATLEGRNQ